jgi:hypothetical protein
LICDLMFATEVSFYLLGLMVVLVGALRRKSERMLEIRREGPGLGEPNGNDTSKNRRVPTLLRARIIVDVCSLVRRYSAGCHRSVAPA